MKFGLCLFLLPGALVAQTVQVEDVLTFINGEKMSGHLKGATNSGIIFQSEMVGEVRVDWSRIKELRSANGFAALAGSGNRTAESTAVAVAPPPLPTPPEPPRVVAAVIPPPPPPVPVPAAPVPPAPVPASSPATPATTPQSVWIGRRIFGGWTGNANVGFSYTDATQSNESLNAGVSMMRTSPGHGAWPVRTRTYINFSILYAKLTQNGDIAYFDPTTRMLVLPGAFSKTYLVHGDILRDYFIFPRVFVFGGATFDHNYAQSLDLLQSYGGGLGVVAYKTKRSELDFRGGVGYTQQQYDGYPAFDKKLAGSRFNVSYEHKFENGMSVSGNAGVRPAWNDSKAIFAGGQLTFTVPIYHRFGLSISSFDFWNNNPPPIYQRNIFQVTLGANYSF